MHVDITGSDKIIPPPDKLFINRLAAATLSLAHVKKKERIYEAILYKSKEYQPNDNQQWQ